MRTVIYLQTGKETACARLKRIGTYRELAQRNIALQTVPMEKCDIGDIRKLVAFWDACGLIVDCLGLRPPDCGRIRPGFPVVFLDMAREFETPQRFSVSYDIRATCQLAARELLSLNSACVAYAGYGATSAWSEERRRVFEKALKLNGRACETFSLTPSDTPPPVFFDKLSSWLASLPKPCAIFAADDAYAVLVHSVARNLRLRIPHDLALLGVDDESDNLITPGISSIRLDFLKAGYLAAKLMLDRLARRHSVSTHLHFGPIQLFRRGSTRRLRRANENIANLLERIRAEAPRGLSAAEVASWLPGSRRLSELRFREVTGHSILEEITAARIDHAKELLAGTAIPIGEIADMCGYRTTNAFRDAFKAVTGRTPRAWRK